MTNKTEFKTARAEADTALASTPVNLAKLGLHEVAYVRPAIVDNVQVWSIHNAAGDAVGVAPTFNQAWAAIVQNDLQPVSVH